MRLRASIALVFLLGACGDDSPLVPFKLKGKASGTETTTGGPVPEQEPTAGTSYPGATERATVQGHTLSVKGHVFRAALEADLNQDGRRDVLFVLQDERGVPRLGVAIADAEGLGSIELKTALAGEGESCAVESAALSRLSATFALIRMHIACGDSTQLPVATPDAPEAPPAPPEPGEPIPPPTEPTGAAGLAQLIAEPLDVLVSIDGEPAIVERLHIDESAPTREPAQVSVEWSASDVDADGHIDLALKLTTRSDGESDAQEPITLAMNLLDRPSGLALDIASIEKTWLALADESKLARKGQPDKAYALAKRVLTSHAALCRESGHALIEIDGERGIPCGPSLAAGRSASIEIAVLARRGQLLPALDRSEALQHGSVYTLTDNDRERVRYAISERTRTAVWRPGPTVVLGATPPVHRSTIAFLDEHRLLSRGVQGALAHDLVTNTQEPASAILGDLVIHDPANKRALTALATRCDGIHGTLMNAAQIVAGVTTGTAIAEPILWPSSHSTAACEKANVAFDDAPELHVVSWTRAGIVLAVAGQLYVVPIDDANVTSPPLPRSALGTDALSNLGASNVSGGGGIVLVPTAAGLARVSADGTMLIAWPAGVTRSAVSDVAISPSGQRVAILASGRVQFADLNEAPPVIAPATDPAATPTPTPAPNPSPPAPPEPTNAPP